MNKIVKIVGLGILLWLIPFLASFPLFDPVTNQTVIPETFFKTIMIVIGALVGVAFAVYYFKGIKKDYLKEGAVIGIAWLVINWMLDLAMVSAGFFSMSVETYFTDIGLRYLSILIFAVGMGYLLEKK
ncbi:hypothetical protein K8R43_02665 [archaeon]|nr:hypothetical protein [archaeon]